MKCTGCGSENPASSRFCSTCGLEQATLDRCEACGRKLPAGAAFCPDCGFRVDAAPTLTPSESFERSFYQEARFAFFHRFVERVEKKDAQCSLYGVIRHLSKRSIELDLAGSLSELAAFLDEQARPFAISLRQREILSELTAFLASISGEFQRALASLDKLGRLAAADLVDYRLNGTASPLDLDSTELRQRIWPGIGTSFGPAIEHWRIDGEISAETEIILKELNHSFLEFVEAYDRLWLPFFNFLERYMAMKCHLIWNLLATYELDFQRYSAFLLEAKRLANEGLLQEALEATRSAHKVKPHEHLPPLLEGHLLLRLGDPEAARRVLEGVSAETLPFVGLRTEKFFWTGRSYFDLGEFAQAALCFEAVVAQLKEQVHIRSYCESQYYLALIHLLSAEYEEGAQHLIDAIIDGYSTVDTLIEDPRLQKARANAAFLAALKSIPFLQALGRQAGILPLGSTYMSRSATPIRLGSGIDGWLDLESGEDVVFFFDASRTGSGRHGLCLTDRRLIWKENNEAPQKLALHYLGTIELRPTSIVLNGELKISDQVFDRLESMAHLLGHLRRIYSL